MEWRGYFLWLGGGGRRDSEHMKVMECARIVLDTEGKKGPRTEAGDDISDACE